jgi:hypothetical protein
MLTMWRASVLILCAAPSLTACVRQPCVASRSVPNWHVIVGAEPQRVSADALGIAADTRVRLGQLWLQIGAKMYPLTKEAGETELELSSPSPAVDGARSEDPMLHFVPAGFHDETLRTYSTSNYEHGTEFASGIEVAVRADRELSRSVQGVLKTSEARAWLEVHLVGTNACDVRSLEKFEMTGDPCFLGTSDCRAVLTRTSHGTIPFGPFELKFEVSTLPCAVAL